MAVNADILKAVVSFYWIDSETAFERHRSCISINDVNTVLAMKKHLISFLGLMTLSSKYGLRDFVVWNFITWLRNQEGRADSETRSLSRFALLSRKSQLQSILQVKTFCCVQTMPREEFYKWVTFQWSWYCWYRSQTHDLPVFRMP